MDCGLAVGKELEKNRRSGQALHGIEQEKLLSMSMAVQGSGLAAAKFWIVVMADALSVQPIPYQDPVAAFAPFAGDPVAAFLDSAAEIGGRGRYSYIAADPFRVITAGGGAKIDSIATAGDPFELLSREMRRYRLPAETGLPPFQTGAVGILGYELGRHLERLPKPAPNDLDFPDMVIGLYDTIASFDAKERRAWVIASDFADGGPPSRRRPAAARAAAMAERILSAPPLNDVEWTARGAWRAEIARSAYERSVAKVIDYIFAGDIFQANLSQRFLGEIPAGLHPFMLYRRLRALSPAPFAAYLACGEGGAVVSASPERFLRLGTNGGVETRPIKGTRPRGQTPEEDRKLAAGLRASEKDRAENLMIVDLLRNDLSRICILGSVRVTDLFKLESFANVHHLVSEVRGRLAPGRGAVDLLAATFPGGSVTGAPKIRAMEIITELEPARRGPYCGSIAWLGFNGTMESNIVIRTVTVKNGTAVAQAGGGIVADSDPAAEYDEAITKIGALLACLDGKGAY
jgi:para-aminobenzoate synthetase component 1